MVLLRAAIKFSRPQALPPMQILRRLVQKVLPLLLLTLVAAPTFAQSDAVTVEIEWPNQGETLYGGPESLLYKVPIKGTISSPVHDLQAIDVQMELFQGGVLLGTLQHSGQPDGSFAFEATVNPHGSMQEFTIGFTDCGLLCHSEGEMALEPGPLMARITATAPDGTRAQAERHFIVDIATMASIPVDIVLAGDDHTPVSGVTVSAATWLYLWRSRFGAAQSNELGRADVRVEALRESPTTYLLRIQPTIVDGVLYQGQHTVTVQLPPGATKAPAIQLTVQGLRGRIQGHLMVDGEATDYSVRAISLPDGNSFEAVSSADGSFVFEELPIDQYLLASAGPTSGSPSLPGPDRRHIDLTQQLTETVRLSQASLAPRVRGSLQSDDGRTLPFGWVNDGSISSGVLPHSGEFFLCTLDADGAAITANAPGYYAVAVRATGQQAQEQRPIALQPQPGTQRLAWGAGYVTLPAENIQQLGGRTITLERGWMWGAGSDDEPITIVTPVAQISVFAAHFALQYLPDQQAWFTLLDGEAHVREASSGREFLLQGRQMLNLLNAEGLTAVPYDSFVLSALEANDASPLPPIWEPTLGARLHNTFARLGIGTAQAITFLTYLLITASLVVLPLAFLRHRRNLP